MAMHLNLPSLGNLGSLISLILMAGVIYGVAFVTYRLFFHPLAKYPGPFLAKVTGLYTTYHAVIGDRHIASYKLHQKYGSVVRVGPNVVSFDSKEALKDIYSVKPNVKKDFLYHVVTSQFGFASTFSTTDREEHARKKRVLAPGFTDASLRNMEEFALKHIRNFVQTPEDRTLGDEQSSTVDLGHWATTSL